MNLIPSLIAAKRIRMEIDPATIFSPELPTATNVYTIILRHGRRKLKIPQADRKKHKPSAAAVLEALIEDAALFERTGTYQKWCEEYGCDPKEGIARREYCQVSWYTEALRQFLGHEIYTAAVAEWVAINDDLRE